VETGSVHGAADALNLTGSAVSKRLKALELRTGVELIERGRAGLTPTAAGRVLYPEAKHALASLRRAEIAVADHRRSAGTHLALASSHTVGEFLLPGWLASFRAERPGLRAEVEIVNSPGVLRRVRDRTVQIGFVEGLDPVDDLRTLTLRADEVAVIVAADHRWARRAAVYAADLADEPYYTREAGSGTRAVATQALRDAGLELTPALEAASIQSVKVALATGGFALLSPLVVEAEQAMGTLTALPVADLDLTRGLRAVHDPSRPLTGLPSAFWAWLARLGRTRS
jgi:DNA-binding transcriptional LysR family regulator